MHAVLQHTPSTQLPDRHWLAMVHRPPLGRRGVHTPASQKLPMGHCESMVHMDRHPPMGPQPMGHSRVVAAEQLPAPSQKRGLVSVLPVQLPAPHMVSIPA
jgi:hypothetical protein